MKSVLPGVVPTLGPLGGKLLPFKHPILPGAGLNKSWAWDGLGKL